MVEETPFDAQLRHFLDTMLTPGGVAALFGLMVLLIASIASPRLKWVVLALAMWVSCFSFYYQVGVVEQLQLATPLNQIRSYGRPICVALLFCLLIPALMQSRGWRLRVLSGAAVAFFVFELMLSLRIVAAGVTARGLLSIVIFCVLFVVLGIGLSRWLQDWKDARVAVGCIAGAATLFFLGTCYQLIVDRAGIVHKNRLFATTGNPQQAALIIAGSLPALCYFIARPEMRKLTRIALSAVAGFLCIFLVWTGSRTGILMSLVGLALLFRARIGKLLGVALVTGMFVMLAVQLYTESTRTVSEMMMRGDTRSHVWAVLLERFWDAPAFGDMHGVYAVGENSYLSVAANAGLFGLIPLAAMMGFAIAGLWKLQRKRRLLGEHAMLADLVTGSLVAYAVGAMFEGYLLGTMTFQIFGIYIYFAVMRFLLDAAEVHETTAAQWHAEGGYEDLAMEPSEEQPQYAANF